jgi:hypothetical protein
LVSVSVVGSNVAPMGANGSAKMPKSKASLAPPITAAAAPIELPAPPVGARDAAAPSAAAEAYSTKDDR